MNKVYFDGDWEKLIRSLNQRGGCIVMNRVKGFKHSAYFVRRVNEVLADYSLADTYTAKYVKGHCIVLGGCCL